MTKEAKEYWSSPAARNFPESLMIGELTWFLTESSDYYRKTYRRLVKKGWVPADGYILEFGAGASSGRLFPPDIVSERLVATDISPLLLHQNPVPKTRKRVLDAGSDPLPAAWERQFSLVLAMHLSRYLDRNEKNHFAQTAKHALAPQGRLLLMDTPHIPNREVAAVIGEAGPFNMDQECAILDGIGLTNINSGSFFVEFFDRFGDRTGAHIDYVTAINK